MSGPSRRPVARPLLGTALAVGMAMAALPIAAQEAADPAASTAGASPMPAPVPLTVGLGYQPSVQFAQFYLADQAGYYSDAGLDVTFQHMDDFEIITLLGQGALDIGLADGTSLIPARSQGIPVRYGATVFARFPNVVFTKASSGIERVEDLAGKRIGTPGPFGSSWIMLQALLASAGLTTEDVRIDFYDDYGQGVALAADRVNAATGYANNEPVQLRLAGEEIDLLRVDDVAPLPGPGLVVGDVTLETRADAVRAFTAATLRAMEEIIADPQKGVDAALTAVPELAADPGVQRAILDATVEAWQSPYTDANGLGSVDRETWASALEIMSAMPVVPNPISVDDLLTDALLP